MGGISDEVDGVEEVDILPVCVWTATATGTGGVQKCQYLQNCRSDWLQTWAGPPRGIVPMLMMSWSAQNAFQKFFWLKTPKTRKDTTWSVYMSSQSIPGHCTNVLWFAWMSIHPILPPHHRKQEFLEKLEFFAQTATMLCNDEEVSFMFNLEHIYWNISTTSELLKI